MQYNIFLIYVFQAMRYLERALKHQPNNVPCRFHKARLLFDTGRYAQAKTELEELKVLSPDEANVFFLLGRVNRKLGNTHMALLNFRFLKKGLLGY
jgi:anaphase-promoting complex subunit 3